MKSPYLNFLASTISRLDPIYPRDPFLDGSQRGPPPDHGHHHGGGHHAEAAAHGAAHGGHAAASAVPFGLHIAQYAALLALLSGLSMPIGAMIGLKLRPAHTTVAQWIAVGAGALLFAVSVELYGHAIHSYHAGHMEQIPMIILLVMSLIGSFGFTWITKAISGEEDDSDSEEEEEVHCAAPAAAPAAAAGKATPPRQDSPKSPLRAPSTADSARLPSKMDTPMSHQPQLARAYTVTSSVTMDPPGTTKSESRLKHIHKTTRGVKGLSAMLRQMEGQRKLMAQKRWAHLREAMKKYHVVRYMQKITQFRQTQKQQIGRQSFKEMNREFWDQMKRAWGQTNDSGPNPEELSQIQKDNRAAALNMLAMLSVDGVPEGILMGFMAAGGSLGVTFIISLFIANFPEAFAGGVLMMEGGFDTLQILAMWGGLMLLVASCAGTSCYMLLWLNPTYTGGHSAPLSIQILVAITEGLAGGAMISGIAACMLPEAYERRDKKGAIVLSGGFLCTFGFLLSLGIKIVLD